MMYLERSSPSTDRFLKADHILSKVQKKQISYHSPPQKLSGSSKRKLSGEYQELKKSKIQLKQQEQHKPEQRTHHQYPSFELPDGGILEQTPYGNIRITKKGKTEIATLDKTITLDSFKRLSSPIPVTPKSPVRNHARIIHSPSPSCDAESYIIEGYRDANVNKSYSHHYDNILNVNYGLYDHDNEDAHLDEDFDYEMN